MAFVLRFNGFVFSVVMARGGPGERKAHPSQPSNCSTLHVIASYLLAAIRTCAGVAKRTWTAEEDTRLVKLVKLLGVGNWAAIANEMSGGRKSKQCRERWNNQLDPDVKKGLWTPEEDAIIIARQKTVGNRWARVAEHLVGRTDMAVKNRWHTFVRLAQRKGSETIKSTTPNESAAAAMKRRGGGRTCGSRAAARRVRVCEAAALAISSSSVDDHMGDDDDNMERSGCACSESLITSHAGRYLRGPERVPTQLELPDVHHRTADLLLQMRSCFAKAAKKQDRCT